MLQDNERDIQQREKWRRERAERDRKRDSIEAAIKVDSNAVIINQKSEINRFAKR